MRKLITVITLSAVFCGGTSYAQQKGRYDNDVKSILAYEKMYQVPSHPIVFVGSSSIRKWDDLQEVFGNYKVINRGIGGAVIDDIAYYADQLIFHYQPRQIVLYIGDNDVTRAEETADTIVNKTVALYKQIRAKMPDIPLIYISIKPSPSREKYRDKIETANKALQQFFAGQPNVRFIDVYPLMLAKDGSFRRELFQPDMTHMVPQGYHIWEKALKQYLIKPE